MWQERVKFFARSHKVQIAAASMLSFAAGVSIGYLVTKKKLEAYYVSLAEQEITEARRYYVKLEEKPDLEDLVRKNEDESVDPDSEISMVESAVKIMRKAGYIQYDNASDKSVVTEDELIEVQESIQHNIFDSAGEILGGGGYVLDDELDKKNAGKPWICEEEYFLENPMDYQTSTLSYYTDDDTVADDADQAMSASQERNVIGEGNLKFGYGSNSKNTVYIVNDNLQIIAEVVRTEGSFKEIVLGYPSTESLEHSYRRQIRKFRPED